MIISVVCLLVFGSSDFIIPSMTAILVFLSAVPKLTERGEDKA